MNIPAELKYSSDHEWVRVEGEFAIIGISDFAQHELGDIVFVDVSSEGETMSAGDVFGTIEAVKTVSDLVLPVSGEIVEFNTNLESEASVVNSEPYNGGWIIKVKMSNPAEVNALMDSKAYSAHIGL